MVVRLGRLLAEQEERSQQLAVRPAVGRAQRLKADHDYASLSPCVGERLLQTTITAVNEEASLGILGHTL